MKSKTIEKDIEEIIKEFQDFLYNLEGKTI
jgi:hypothetical protein